MQFKKLNSNFRISTIGLGTWKIGGEERANTRNDRENILAIKTAIKLGITHIDTAEMYGNGHTEELVGEAIQEFRRDKIFVTTKVKPENLRYNDVISAAKRSLKRLRTSYIDLYLIHAYNPDIPVEETMKAMDYLVKNKLVRFIGVSNFSVEQIEEAQRYTNYKIVANEIEYSLLYRESGTDKVPFRTVNTESKIIPYCQQNDIIVIAYRPLAQGELTKAGIEMLDELAKKYSKTPSQIALNWLICKPNIVAIPKATKTEHIRDNIGATGWKLRERDIHRLDREFPKKGINI